MLDVAGKYEQELQNLFANIMFNDKYKFYLGSSYMDKYKPYESTWNGHEFVSIHDRKIIGYMGYTIDRDANFAYSLRVINFEDKNLLFSKDLKRFLQNIFEKFNFRKLKFGVVVGNPIEKAYDRICLKFGGRIVGTYKQDTKLFDGQYYDWKMYEIFREDYLKSKIKN